MADVIHKNEDLSNLSEAEQLELVMRESEIDALSKMTEDQQIAYAMQMSLLEAILEVWFI